jgi:hypothetical protein
MDCIATKQFCFGQQLGMHFKAYHHFIWNVCTHGGKNNPSKEKPCLKRQGYRKTAQ